MQRKEFDVQKLHGQIVALTLICILSSIAGCTSITNLPLSENALQNLSGRKLVISYWDSETVLPPNYYSQSVLSEDAHNPFHRPLMEFYPADYISLFIMGELKQSFSLSEVVVKRGAEWWGGINLVNEDTLNGAEDLLLDIRANGWASSYRGLFSSYYLMGAIQYHLVDAKNLKVLSSGFYFYNGNKNGVTFSDDEIIETDGVVVQKARDKMIASMIDNLSVNLLLNKQTE